MKKRMMIVIYMLMWSNVAYAACVATIPASTPTVNFTDNGNGTVTDLKTGLMWKQCSEGLSGVGCVTGAASVFTWQGALQAASAMNVAGGFAGHTDWRVPNIKELNSIVERQCTLPAINATLFPNIYDVAFWSSSPLSPPLYATHAWSVIFSNGTDNGIWKTSNNYVRLVRGGL